ncbi:hypothetical protein [Paenibacillus albus]|uniref:Copper amine oxidase-like N-terminal domain-containing protein n=1 Tax=Paenibacillus albus TaxID=2495582 RepID=A0A3Q8X7B1_9BACL|nr:hypothetical protein [Paenibacillus albus]AZN42153.1 hypothetical protein EJC50_22570 [Paenibacillus albus]
MKLNKKKVIIVATLAGLMATTAAVEASGFLQKVQGFLRSDITVSVDGSKTSMKPVFINGQAYLPAKSEAAALGYDVTYNAREKRLELTNKEEQGPGEQDLIRMQGIIESVETGTDGSTRITVLGRGGSNWMVLSVDKDTVLTDSQGKKLDPKSLKPGQDIQEAQYGPIVAMSYPGQSHAAKVIVGSDHLVKDAVIQSVKKTDDGWQVTINNSVNGESATAVVLNSGKETQVVDQERQPLEFSKLKAGQKVRAYYGPIMTKSLPPISPVFYLVADTSTAAGTLSPAAVAEFQTLSWNTLTGDQKSHLKSKKEEAEVTLVNAADSGILASTDEQKKALADLKAKGGSIVVVSYKTDQDELIGPLSLGFDSDSKALLGYGIRK